MVVGNGKQLGVGGVVLSIRINASIEFCYVAWIGNSPLKLDDLYPMIEKLRWHS